MAGNFEIFRDADKLYRFRLMDERGGILVTSAGYGHKADVVTAITAVREHAAMGHIQDCSDPAARARQVRQVRRRATA